MESPRVLTEHLDQIRDIVEEGDGRVHQPIHIVGALVSKGLGIEVAAFFLVREFLGEIIGLHEHGRQGDNQHEAGKLKTKRESNLHPIPNPGYFVHGEKPFGQGGCHSPGTLGTLVAGRHGQRPSPELYEAVFPLPRGGLVVTG